MLTAVAEEVRTSSNEPVTLLRRLRLTPANAAKVARELDAVLRGVEEEEHGSSSFGVLVSVFATAGQRNADSPTDNGAFR